MVTPITYYIFRIVVVFFLWSELVFSLNLFHIHIFPTWGIPSQWLQVGCNLGQKVLIWDYLITLFGDFYFEFFCCRWMILFNVTFIFLDYLCNMSNYKRKKNPLSNESHWSLNKMFDCSTYNMVCAIIKRKEKCHQVYRG